MAKTIKSPVKKWPGEVVLSDPLTLPQVIKLQEALEEGKGLGEVTRAKYQYVWLPAIINCIEEVNLKGLNGLEADTFPGTPNKASAELFNWLLGEVLDMFDDAEDAEVPKKS